MPSWTKTVYEGGEGEITEKKARLQNIIELIEK